MDAAGDAADIGTAADGDRAHAVGYGARISVSRDRTGIVAAADGAGDGEVFDRRVKDIAEKALVVFVRFDIKPRHRVAAAVEDSLEDVGLVLADRRPRLSAEVDVGGEVDRLAFESFSAGVDELRQPREVRRGGDVEVVDTLVFCIPLLVRGVTPIVRRARGREVQPRQRRRADKREQRQAEALRAAAALPGRKSQLLNDLPDESHL